MALGAQSLPPATSVRFTPQRWRFGSPGR
jgi:hypothetical protein